MATFAGMFTMYMPMAARGASGRMLPSTPGDLRRRWTFCRCATKSTPGCTLTMYRSGIKSLVGAWSCPELVVVMRRCCPVGMLDAATAGNESSGGCSGA
ncbi:hypothetical protein V8C43DRAFT_276780 [Trichoderma afarasin]